MPRGWSVQAHDWEALLSECADSWELGDTYADGPRQLLEDGSVIGTIAMHISQHEEVVAAAPAAVAEVIRLRRALEEQLKELSDELEAEGVETHDDIAGTWPSMQRHGELSEMIAQRNFLTRILEGDNDE